MAKAWIVTWESPNQDQSVREDRISAVLSGRLSVETVGQFIERYYAANKYTPVEQFSYLRSGKRNPYEAKVEKGAVYCGHNPFLWARKVSGVKVKTDQEGEEFLDWDNYSPPGNPLVPS